VENFVARQPILDASKRVFGYELLFRSGPENVFRGGDGDLASSTVIQQSLLVFWWDALLAGKKGFVNVTRKILLQELYAFLPKSHTVVELLETVEIDDEVLRACKALKRAGYELALDDVSFGPQHEPLLPLVDILKIDFMTTTPEQQKAIAERCRGSSIRLLAEKVETQEVFHRAQDLGYELFQGYFFCRPEMVTQKDIPSSKLSYVRFLQEIHRPEIDYKRLEQVFKQDVALSLKLLRYLNSAAFGFRQTVKSIRDGLVLLGERPLKKWASLAAFSHLASDKPTELVVTGLLRARMCELIGPTLGLRDRELDLFLVGMFSVLDALLDKPLPELLAPLSISSNVKGTLLGEETELSAVYRLAHACASANWEEVNRLADRVPGGAQALAEMYRQSAAWASQVSSM
jgi:EAL and modified HD-GYP domain-containing signal transduction protein